MDAIMIRDQPTLNGGATAHFKLGDLASEHAYFVTSTSMIRAPKTVAW